MSSPDKDHYLSHGYEDAPMEQEHEDRQYPGDEFIGQVDGYYDDELDR